MRKKFSNVVFGVFAQTFQISLFPGGHAAAFESFHTSTLNIIMLENFKCVEADFRFIVLNVTGLEQDGFRILLGHQILGLCLFFKSLSTEIG